MSDRRHEPGLTTVVCIAAEDPAADLVVVARERMDGYGGHGAVSYTHLTLPTKKPRVFNMCPQRNESLGMLSS